MTTIHTRHRRLLSMDRRGGIQVSPDVADGRALRYSQSWRELNHPSEPLEISAGIMHALVVGLCAWILIALAVVGAVALLG